MLSSRKTKAAIYHLGCYSLTRKVHDDSSIKPRFESGSIATLEAFAIRVNT